MMMPNNDRPGSDGELDAVLDTAYAMACKGDYTKALALCDRLMQDDMAVIAAQRQRAAIFSHQGNIKAAIADLEQVVRAFPCEPADFHALGILQLQAGDAADAVENFRKAVRADAAADSSYYTNSSLMFSAAAQLMLGNFSAAIAGAARLPDGYKVYIPGTGIRTKEDVISKATGAASSGEKASL
ncbi:hypothetical protein KY495_04540 [Massilia sp. PAMC28688]|uniref:tetratricopeptide repeat protein n=1 Tax=Massilia sp. PAMC28688 TaxID=2861283 RepID=UPI001C636F81|nr:hypothetical protein [Massilia sp. PAMC28688]QYF94491.1 hypothetical protein KY495_04540 [Massilia sp. PAMC28688]